MKKFDDIADFQAAMNSIMDADYHRHNFMLTTLASYKGKGIQPILMADADGDAILVGDHNFLTFTGDRADDIAKALNEINQDVDRVLAERSIAQDFSRSWCALTRKTPKLEFSANYLLLDRILPSNVTGTCMRATADILVTIAEWRVLFAKEALPHDRVDPKAEAQAAKRGIENGEIYIWLSDQGKIVSMLQAAPILNRGVRLRNVFTPQDDRGRGFSGALLSAAAQKLQNEGKFVSLAADINHPYTNKYYESRGFRRLFTFEEYGFVD